MTKHARPTQHGRDHEHGGADPHRIHYEDVGDSGGGGDTLAVLFDTYPQDGTFLQFDTDGGGIYINNKDTGDNNPFTLQQQDDGGIQILNTGAGELNIEASSLSTIFIQQTGGGDIRMETEGAGQIRLLSLPTSDPGVSGAVWVDTGGVLKISP